MEARPRASVTGLILAGGAGSRLGGSDKGLVAFNGKPLIETVIQRLAPQAGVLLISANRNLDIYRMLGHEVVTDDDPAQHQGPLAGVLAGLRRCESALLAVVPCDTPRLPMNLVARLAAALEDNAAPVVFAATPERRHPTLMLCRREVLSSLSAWFAQGGHKVGEWQDTVGAVPVLFADEAAFRNLNTPDDLKLAR